MPRDQTAPATAPDTTAETTSDLAPDPSISPAQSADQTAVIAVIRAETQAFCDRDFAAWASCWLHDDRTQAVSVSPTIGLSVIRGWSAIAADMEASLMSGHTCGMVRFRQDGHRVSVDGDTAWVVFDGWAENEAGAGWTTFETRILERGPDGWKIVYNAFVLRRDPGDSRREVSVDATGRILWASAGSLDALKGHPVFTVSAGRLRAHRREWDKVLQREIARAGQYHEFFAYQEFTADAGGPLDYPVVLGEADDGGLALASISVRDCVTCVRIDGDARLGRRLRLAKAVFGLSDGQFRLAELVANGDGLKSAADTLGISINTARTHLSRLYEKTGVNSQTALVRLLLSVG